MALNPMHKFEVYKIGPSINLGDINLSFTNASLFMTISAILILSLLLTLISTTSDSDCSPIIFLQLVVLLSLFNPEI